MIKMSLSRFGSRIWLSMCKNYQAWVAAECNVYGLKIDDLMSEADPAVCQIYSYVVSIDSSNFFLCNSITLLSLLLITTLFFLHCLLLFLSFVEQIKDNIKNKYTLFKLK